MNTTFVSYKNSVKHLILTDYYSILQIKLTYEEKVNTLFYQILTFIIYVKMLRSHIRTINLKYQLQHEMKNFNYQMDYILHQIFKIFLDSIKLKIF